MSHLLAPTAVVVGIRIRSAWEISFETQFPKKMADYNDLMISFAQFAREIEENVKSIQ